MKNFQERVTEGGVAGELLSSEREAEGNLRESISPRPILSRVRLISLFMARDAQYIFRFNLPPLSCISFLPPALCRGLIFFSSQRRNRDRDRGGRDETE